MPRQWELPVGTTQLPGTIKKVIVLMLENRGFDHLMGWLYRPSETPHIESSGGDEQPFRGLYNEILNTLVNPYPEDFPDEPPQQPIKGARSPKSPSYNPGEQFQHIMKQMWGGVELPAEWMDAKRRKELIERYTREIGTAPMNGYIRDYACAVKEHFDIRLEPPQLSEIMDTYTPEQVPVLSGLARFYGVSDEWFCSAPTQTNANRAFSMAGTSRGLVNNSFYEAYPAEVGWNPRSWRNVPQNAINKMHHGSNADALPEPTFCLFNTLAASDVSWMVCWQRPWPLGSDENVYVRTMFPSLKEDCFKKNFFQFDASDRKNAFYEALRTGNLPAVTWIEPKWGGGDKWDPPSLMEGAKLKGRAVGNDYHPVSDTTTGEDFVMELYQAMTENQSWQDTLLIITFDENGGTYDHIVPPPVRPTGLDKVPLSDLPPETDRTTRTQFGFKFDQLGIRVPTLLISPRIQRNLVFRSPDPFTPFDHTSIIATILTMAGIDKEEWQLGDRVKYAPTFEHLIRNDQEEPAAEGADPVPGKMLYPRRDALDTPLAALSVPPAEEDGNLSRPRAALWYGKPYRLQYVGNPWSGERIASQFLGASTKTLPVNMPLTKGYINNYYPMLVTQDGINFTFDPRGIGVPGNPGGEQILRPIKNMETLRIKTTEAALSSFPYMGVMEGFNRVFYAKGTWHETNWQIRILSSRDPNQYLEIGDLVYFLTQWTPTGGEYRKDPLLRLMPVPGDSANGKYLTAVAGEWALWKLLPPA